MNLTKPQKLIYDMEKFAGGAISIICGGILFHEKKDLSQLKRVINEIYRINDALRIRINEADGIVSQIVTKYVEKEVEVLCFKDKAELDSYAEDYAKIPLDFYGNLCEIKIVVLPEQCGILLKLHHIIGDAWTLSLIGTQVNKLLNGETVEAYSYADYVATENVYIQSKCFEKDKKFFLEQFKRCDEVTYFSEKQSDTRNAFRRTFIIDENKTKQLNNYAQKNDTSAFILFTAALSVYMNRTKMNAEKFYIGTAVLNRSGVKENNTVGMFVNTVPMLIELDNTKSFAENIADIRQTTFSVLRHQKYNYGEVLSAIRKEYGFNEKLYDVMISYQNATVNGADCKTTWYHCGMQNESLQIHIDDRDSEGIFRIHYDYLADKFSEHEIDMLHQHLSNLLFDAIQNVTKKLYELEILSAEEKQKLLYEFNDTDVDYPRNKCVHQLFEEQVEKTPDKVAVIACDKTLTYSELNKEANRIAHSLIQKGVRVGDIVAFALRRRSYLIATIFGILKAGAAYLPIDPDYPQDRIDYILSDSDTKWFIEENNISELLKNENETNPNLGMTSESLCYCIYTSGTTGNPKGVLIRHKNLLNFCDNNVHNNCQSAMVKNGGVLLSIFKCSFDAFGVDYALALLNGGTMFFPSESSVIDPDALSKIIEDYSVEVIHMTPSMIKTMLSNLKFEAVIRRIKMFTIAAEQFDEKLYDSLSKYGAKIFNGYGPTETTIGVSFGQIVSKDNIHIGGPISNTQIFIVDKYMCPTPIGVTGELCIAGEGVGAGYLNRPELTNEKFIDNPFGKGKLYKTGDLAYWREDGNIVYVGRNDFQVKIRGLRIELGEIENAICSMDGIAQAVVVVRKNKEGRQLICAFYTGTEVNTKDIRAHIGKRLPKYMQPHVCTYLDKIPLTPNGKVNRKALPEVELESITNATEYIEPENKQQKELCKLMELVLGTTHIGIADDFFDLGGDSLKAIEFVSKAHNEGIYFNLQNVFDYPTVKALCECIQNDDKQNVSFSDVDFADVHKMLEMNKLENITVLKESDVGNVFLAGATGYLGIHILAEYLDHDRGTAYCLVRGKDKEDSICRLQEQLRFYFGDKYADMKRIEVICADLQKERFALAEAEYNHLLSKVNTVINSAASVKHYGTYKYFYEANVETTKSLIEFCKISKAKLIHTSTLSVSGNGFDKAIVGTEKRFSESSLYVGQSLENVYAHSKFEAEREILNAMTEGLHANIMRMGNLTNRMSDGMFQRNYQSNAFLNRIKALIDLKVFSDTLANVEVEFTPVDEAARAVMMLARHFSDEQNVFHLNNPKVLMLTNLFEKLQKFGYEFNRLTDAEFNTYLSEALNQENMEHILETFINDMDENNKIKYDSNIRIESDFTVQYLKRLGFEWSDIDIEYLQKYVEYFKKIGYMR